MTLISPPVNVLLIAPANVLQGAVRLPGFASSPTPETHVRVTCDIAIMLINDRHHTRKKRRKEYLFILLILIENNTIWLEYQYLFIIR
jgi:hypothetical protein